MNLLQHLKNHSGSHNKTFNLISGVLKDLGRRTVNEFEMARLVRHVRNNQRRRDRLRDNNIRRLLQNLKEQRITISEFVVVAVNFF